MPDSAIHDRSGPRVDLVVLDIAGTTVQEHGSVYACLGSAVRAGGGDPRSEDVAHWMGADKHEAIRALLQCGRSARSPVVDEEVVSAVYTDFRTRLAQAYRDRPPEPMSGVVDALAALRRNGVMLALTTGFTREVTTGLLDALGWDDRVVDAVVTVDDVPAGRPAPYMIFRSMERTGASDVSRVLVAGDTTRDLQAGTRAGAGFVIGVLTGGMDAASLGRVRHTHLLAGVADIPALVL